MVNQQLVLQSVILEGCQKHDYLYLAQLENVPPDCPRIKICWTCHAYYLEISTIPAKTEPVQQQMSAQRQHVEEISHMIDNYCKTGVSTDAVLKLGQSSKCTNVSCLCSLTSSRLVSVIVGTPRTETPVWWT